MSRCLASIRTVIKHLYVLALLSLSLLPAWLSANEFLPVDEAMPMTFHSDGEQLVVDWVIEPEHYMYRDITAITLADGTPLDQTEVAGELELSNHDVERYDETFDEVMPVFYEYQTARVTVDSDEPIEFRVTYQGCAEAGLCYPPQTHSVTWDPTGELTGGTEPASSNGGGGWFSFGGGGSETAASNGAPSASGAPGGSASAAMASPANFTSGGLAEWLGSASLLFSVGLFFLLGVGLVFTPCVLPMIPIMSALVLGENRPSTPRALVIALVYVLAMALTYAVAGVVAASLGAAGNIQAALQTPWVLTVFAAIFALLALAMFGLFNLQTPGPLNNLVVRLQNRIQGGGLGSVAGIGSLSALVVSPCITAPLAGALLYISATGDAMIGFASLLALGLGMGLPLIVVAVGGARWLPKTGAWMQQVKVLFGVMLLAVAVWLISRWLNPVLSLVLWGLLAVGYAIWLGALDKAAGGAAKWRKAAGVVVLVYGVAALWGSFQGGTDPLRPIPTAGSAANTQEAPFMQLTDVASLEQELTQAAAAGEPVMLDLYADWCVSCKVMERRIFMQADVQEKLSDHRWLQLDITAFDASHQALLDDYGVFGPPTILFYDSAGDWSQRRSIVGEVSKSAFLQHLGLI